MDNLHAELATIDENLERQELTILERSEQLSRWKEIYEALHPETKRGNGPGRGYKEKKRKGFASFTDDTASKTGQSPRTIEQDVQIATNLSDGVKEKIRALPIANKKSDLLLLARSPQETQEAIADPLASGRAKSVREAKKALNVGSVAPDATPDLPRSPQGEAPDSRPSTVELHREDRDTLLHTVMRQFQLSSVIIDSQIAGRPSAEVMTERLAALPKPEVVLLAGLLTGPMHVAAQA
jgi:ParB family transcriptional regulator, chromosome partitioning protein